MSRRLETGNSKRQPTPALARTVLVSFLFIFGLCAIVGTASNPGQYSGLFMNPYKMATGKNSEKINSLLRELNSAEYELANTEYSSYSTPRLEGRISRLKMQIESLGHKVELYSSSCFTPDMNVLTENGAKPITQIKIGDRVLSYDEKGDQVMADVLNTYESKNNHFYLINRRIKVTAQHRFYTGGGWKKAKDLEVGDQIQTSAGTLEKIKSIQWVPKDLQVYNLTISKNHNFYVSADGKQGYLVHNTAGGGGGGGGGK